MEEIKKIFFFAEESPHIELNQNGSTINLSNWNEPANRNWSYRHIVDIFPYAQKIAKGDKVHKLGKKLVDLSSVTVTYQNRPMPLEEFLYESHCNGLLVLKGNDIIYENYRRMQANERHLVQSISKTTLCAIISELVENGIIDVSKTVDEYIPEVADGYAGVKIQDVLDMNVAADFSEDFTNPNSDIFHYEMITGWHPDKGGQQDGLLPYICQLKHDANYELDGTTHYLCSNTDLLGCIIEKVTGKRYTALFEEKIYRHIGAEADAYFSTDATGMAICSGGLIIRLRDLARYGQLFANKGRSQTGVQVIPENWINRCLDASKGTTYLAEGYKYHNQMTTNGEVLCHLGIGGQMLYANTATKVVVVQFSTLTAPSNGDLDTAVALYALGGAINAYVS